MARKTSLCECYFKKNAATFAQSMADLDVSLKISDRSESLHKEEELCMCCCKLRCSNFRNSGGRIAKTVQLALARSKLISKLEEEFRLAFRLTFRLTLLFFVERNLLQFVLQKLEVHVTVFSLLEIRTRQPKRVVSPRAAGLYPTKLVFWSSEFELDRG